MSLETDVIAALDNDATLAALVSNRNYIVKLPQQPTYPNNVISFYRIIENNLQGETSLEHAEMQVDCRANTYAEARAVSEAVGAALAAATNFQTIGISEDDFAYDDDIETYRIVMRFSIWQ